MPTQSSPLIESKIGSNDKEQKMWQNAPNDLDQAAAELPQAYINYRKAGFHFTNHDASSQQLDDQKNSIAYLLAANQKFGAIEEDLNNRKAEAPKGLPGKNPPPEDWTLEVYREPRSAAIFSLISTACEQPAFDYHHEVSSATTRSYVQFSDLRRLVELECVKAEDQLRDNKPKEAAQTLSQAWKVAGLISKDYSIIAVVSGCICSNSVLTTVERCIGILCSKSPDSIRFGPGFNDFCQNLSFPPQSANLRECFMRRGADAAQTALQIDGTVTGMAAESENPPFPKTVEGRAYLCRTLQMWTKEAKYLPKLDTQPDSTANAIDADFGQVQSHLSQSYRLLEIELSELSPTATSVEHTRQYLTSEELLIKAMTIREKSGSWPKTLQEISPSAADPNSGFRWSLAKGFAQVIWNRPGALQLPIPVKVRERRGTDDSAVASYPALPFRDGRNLRGVIISIPPSRVSTVALNVNKRPGMAR